MPARVISSGGGAAGVGCRDDGAGAHSGNAMDRNLVLLEDAERADVRHAARESATQRETQSAWARALPATNGPVRGAACAAAAEHSSYPKSASIAPSCPSLSDGIPLSWMRTHFAKFRTLFLCFVLLASAFAQAPFSGTPAIEQSLRENSQCWAAF